LKISGHPGNFDLKIRVPYWARDGILVKVNGDKLEIAGGASLFPSKEIGKIMMRLSSIYPFQHIWSFN